MKKKKLNQPPAPHQNKIVGWLFLVYRPFETEFQSISGRLPKTERKKREKIDERKKCSNNPHPHPLQAQKVLALLSSKLEGRPGTENSPTTFAPLDHPNIIKTKAKENIYLYFSLFGFFVNKIHLLKPLHPPPPPPPPPQKKIFFLELDSL